MALFHRDKVKNSDLISFFLKKFSRIPQDFAFRVKDYKRGIALHKVGLTVKSCFTCTGTAAYQCIQISSVLFRIQSDTDILRHQLVIGIRRLSVLLIHGSCIAPFCRTVFLPPAVVSLCGEIYPDTHSIAQKQDEDSFYAVLTNFYMKRIVKYIHQARQYLRQSAFN